MFFTKLTTARGFAGSLILLWPLALMSCSESSSIGTAPENDSTHPAITLTSSSGLVLADGPVVLTATVSDDQGVTAVDFYDGATLLSTDKASPFEFTVNYTETDNGRHAPSAESFVITVGSVVVASFARGAQLPDWTAFTAEFVAGDFTHTIGIWAEWDCDDSSYEVDNQAVDLKL